MEKLDDVQTDGGEIFFDAAEEWKSFDTWVSPETTESIFQDEVHRPTQSSDSLIRNRRHLHRGSSSHDPRGIDSEEDIVPTSDIVCVHETPETTGEISSVEGNVRGGRSLSGPSSIAWELLREDQDVEKSTVTSHAVDEIGDFGFADWPSSSERSTSSNVVAVLGGIVMKALGFQFLLVSTVMKLPFLSMYYSVALVFSPYATVIGGIESTASLFRALSGSVLSLLNRWLKEYKPFLFMALRFTRGLAWCVFIWIVLGTLLVSSFAAGFLALRCILEEPLRMKETLYLDYTEDSPVAYVPIAYCPEVTRGGIVKEKTEPVHSLHVIHPNQKFRITVVLVLPETQYNRNLGIFQVRVESLSGNGDVIAVSRHPCMFPFRSQTVNLLMTYLKILPVLTGYLTETQTLNLRVKDFNEGTVPTACIMVTIEQRAEYKAGAGIPEIYEASLLLESELPFLKRVMWNWRWTILVWIGMIFFMTCFLLMLLCCAPLLFPGSSPSRHASDHVPALPAAAEMG